MFLRDEDLSRRKKDDRARVLQQAKAQRLERERLKGHEAAARVLQSFLRGRLASGRARAATRADFAQKLADIARLQAVLQLPDMPIPYDVLFELLRKLLFFYGCSAEDNVMVAKMSKLMKNSLDAAPDGLKDQIQDKQKRWQLERFVDVSLQARTLLDPTAIQSVLTTVEALAAAAAAMQEYLVHGKLVDICSVQAATGMRRCFAELPRVPAVQIVRRVLLETKCPIPNPSYYAGSLFCQGLMRFAVSLLQSEPSVVDEFVPQILSVPLLHEAVSPEHMAELFSPFTWSRIVGTGLDLSTFNLPTSPVMGISSETWLLGNVLWVSERVRNKDEKVILKELQLLIKLLQAVPPAAYAPNGVSVSWTKVSESHSMPVVFPEALNAQLRILLRDQYIRSMCDSLLSFNPESLRRPLATERPAPMYPTAPTIAEQFGFGDIASALSLSASISMTWQKVKSVGKATWAKLLLEKTGLQRNRELDATTARNTRSSLLENKSHESREIAANGKQGKLQATGLVKKTSRLGISREPFTLGNVYMLARFCATFLLRWGGDGANRQAHAMRLLNTLAFYQVAVPSSDDRDEHSPRSASFVKFLWCVLQDVKAFEDFGKSVDLLHAKDTDSYVCTLALFCMCYDHLLLVVDDEEMYDQEFPLKICQVERVVLSLKHSLHSAYWIHANVDPISGGGDLAFGMLVVEAATRLMRNLYNRCSRHPFCNVTSWIIPELDSKQLIEEVLAGTPRANKLIYSMPYLVSFSDRVKLFQRIVAADKSFHQSVDNPVYRIRIHRGAILADGLKKLNSIRGNLKKRINVVFVNAAGREEVGIDAGGLFKEFWLDLSTLAFDLQYGLFLTTDEQLLYPNPNSASAHFSREGDHLTLFQFVGRILGKALYEGIVVQPKFAHFFLSKLLHSFNQLNDLPSLDPEIYKNLMFLKAYDGDVEDLGLTHTVVKEEFGEQKEVEIIPGGANIPVTSHNKTRYIHLVANYYLNTQIREQCAAFRAGLSDLIDPRWLQMFNEPELQVLISGKSGQIDIEDLRAHTRYAGGYYALDKRVAWFWQAVASFSPSEQAAFLRFATSCQRAPSLGFEALNPPFCVLKVSVRRDDELLPSSSTCFNTLKLPTYSSYKVLRAKLLVSISSGAGFEMT